jgi:PIN domain nuclease of toxin-antitoxin system
LGTLGRYAKAAAGRAPPSRHDSIDQWFRGAIRATSARIIPIHRKIALEAVNVVLATGHKDPDDTYLSATARVRKIPIVTRDSVMRNIAAVDPDYLAVVVC